METNYTEQIQIYKTNKIAALYPTAKLIIVVLYIFCTLVIGTVRITSLSLPLLLIPEFGIVVFLLIVSEISKNGYNILKDILKFAAIIFFVQVFLIPGGRLVFRLFFLTLYEVGIRSGISLSFSLLNIAGIFIWFFQTTETKEIIRALEDSGVHYKAAYIMLSTFQMIDVLSQNSKTILNAQRARGIETDGNLLLRIKAFIPVLLPLFLTAITGVEERVLALETKGFLVECPKTHLLNVKRSGHETYAIMAAALCTIFILAGRVMLCFLS